METLKFANQDELIKAGIKVGDAVKIRQFLETERSPEVSKTEGLDDSGVYVDLDLSEIGLTEPQMTNPKEVRHLSVFY